MVGGHVTYGRVITVTYYRILCIVGGMIAPGFICSMVLCLHVRCVCV